MVARGTAEIDDTVELSRLSVIRMCAYKADDGIGANVPACVPELGPRTINRQPTPNQAKPPMKTGLKSHDFRPVL